LKEQIRDGPPRPVQQSGGGAVTLRARPSVRWREPRRSRWRSPGSWRIRAEGEAEAVPDGTRLIADDCGTFSNAPVDYPTLALAVAQKVGAGQVARGIMIDGAGIGSCMTANKVPGVRASLCYDPMTARNAREHNDANMLTLGGQLLGLATAREIVRIWLATECKEERHLKRVALITEIERRFAGGAR
jgi:ribose 5-phosphate isomerase B